VGVRRAFLLLLAIVLVAGCGGGSERLTREEYAKRADAICAKFSRQEKAVGKVTDVRGLADAVDRLLPAFDDALKELHKLRPPENEQATATAWLDSLDVLRSDVSELGEKARANDRIALTHVAVRATQHGQKSDVLAGQLGLSVCKTQT
jgi:hypothetical protein